MKDKSVSVCVCMWVCARTSIHNFTCLLHNLNYKINRNHYENVLCLGSNFCILWGFTGRTKWSCECWFKCNRISRTQWTCARTSLLTILVLPWLAASFIFLAYHHPGIEPGARPLEDCQHVLNGWILFHNYYILIKVCALIFFQFDFI